ARPLCNRRTKGCLAIGFDQSRRSRVPRVREGFGMNARVLLSIWFCIGCESSSNEPARSPPPKEAEAPALEVATVIAQRLDTSTRLPAEIYAYESVSLFPRVNGFVDDVAVDRGNSVHKGQLLVRLSAPELVAQRAEAESKLAATRSTYERT